jgi:hypothetical protein
MKTYKRMISIFVLAAFLAGGFIFCLPIMANGTSWLNPWTYRQAVTVSSPCGEAVSDYQVLITLDASFDFSKALSDGSDIRITGSDGVTLLPFWIEEWDAIGQQAGIWVKMPAIPVLGATVYLYYGNPSPPGPAMVETPPSGPWQRAVDNPIRPVGDPGNGESLLGENMVYDPVTAHYWLIFAMYRSGSHVGLAWSDNPSDPTAWNWHGQVVASANAPHILEYNGLWYIIYSDWSGGWGPPAPSICADTSSNIGGPYSRAGVILTVSEAWEAARVDEPFLFQRSDGKWVLMYMGDAGGTTEQVGFATADDIMGPYTKFAGNPCIAFGPSGSYDAGTVADAWVVELNGVFYIGYTVSSTKSSPWRTAMATTTDWMTFTKQGIILDLGSSGAWDQYDAFRGAVTRIGDTYYFPYTGKQSSNYLMGIATQPVLMPEAINSPDEVFQFADIFEGDLSKWVTSYSGSGGSASINCGILTITGITTSYVQMRANTEIGTGTLLEAYAGHEDAGLNPGAVEGNAAAEIGYKPGDMGWTNVMRIMDWPNLAKYCIQSTAGGVNSGYIPTAVDFNADWHTYRIYRTSDGYAQFQVDANPFEALGSPYVPTVGLYPWLMSYCRNTAPQSRFNVDWIRVRKWCGADAGIQSGPEESSSGSIAGMVTYGALGLKGVTIALYDGDGILYGSAITDNTGYYQFTTIPGGPYTVELQVPLGFVPVGEPSIPVVVAGNNVEVNFELKLGASGKIRTIWWWKGQIQRLQDGLSADFTKADVDNYCQIIFDHYYSRADEFAIQIVNVTYAAGPRALTYDDLEANFLGVYDGSPKACAANALLINLLNVASGRQNQLGVVSVDGATASQAITYFGALYLVGRDKNWSAMHINLRKMHMGEKIPAGVIPLSTPNVMFKQDEDFPKMPTEFRLAQNYPNPFNPATEIEFSLPTSCDVTLEIYNTLGQRVATPIQEFLTAGYHTVFWNSNNSGGSPVASGIYFYRLKAGNFVDTKKMILLK